MTPTDFAVVMISAASPDEARGLADALVEQRLAACVQLAPITSVFRWQGSTRHEEEILLLVKTRAEHFDEIARLSGTLLSYDVPEVIQVPITAGSPAYLRWLGEETAAQQ